MDCRSVGAPGQPGISCQAQIASFQSKPRDFERAIETAIELVNSFGIDVEADGAFESLSEDHGDR